MGSWDEMASGWDEDPAVKTYAAAAWGTLEGYVEAGQRVLDFGCGTGLLTERLATRVREVVAVDASSEMIKVLEAKALPGVRASAVVWTPTSIQEDPLAQEPFDLIVCSSVCAFLEDYPGAVAMLAARLRPGGHFLQWDWELNPSDEEPYGLTRADIRGALEGAGLEVVSVNVGFEADFEGHPMRPLMGVGRAM